MHLASLLRSDKKLNYFLIFIVSICLGASYYVEHIIQIEPCILCIAQRMLFLLILISILFRAFFVIKSKVLSIFVVLLSLSGFSFALRQIYLQTQTEVSTLSCGLNFFDLFSSLPFNEFIIRVFSADGSCSRSYYEILGLEISEWSSIIFLFIAITIIIKLLLRPKF